MHLYFQDHHHLGIDFTILISSFYPSLYLSVSVGFAFLYILLFNIVVSADNGFIHEKNLL